MSFLQVGSIIGQGSFATVHKAKELSSGRDVALKIVRPEHELDVSPGPNGTRPDVSYDDVLKAMKLEITHIETVGLHPNVICILGTAEDCRVLVMERAIADLFNLVKKYPQLPLALAQRWARGVLEAVAHIHDMGVVHQVCSFSHTQCCLVYSDIYVVEFTLNHLQVVALHCKCWPVNDRLAKTGSPCGDIGQHVLINFE